MLQTCNFLDLSSYFIDQDENLVKSEIIWVLYMSFDKFLLAVESRDLSQADKIIIRVSSFHKAVFE
jgi:hypothetical protein